MTLACKPPFRHGICRSAARRLRSIRSEQQHAQPQPGDSCKLGRQAPPLILGEQFASGVFQILSTGPRPLLVQAVVHGQLLRHGLSVCLRPPAHPDRCVGTDR